MPQAYKIKDLANEGPLNRTAIFEAIKAGKLRAKKAGRSTIVLADDWRNFLHSLPDRDVAPVE